MPQAGLANEQPNTQIVNDLETVWAEVQKISLVDAGDGSAIVGSLAHTQEHIVQLLTGRSFTFGAASIPIGDTHVADIDSLTPFVATSGAGDYGSDPGDTVQIVGSLDAPFLPGAVAGHVIQIFVSDLDSESPYIFRLIWGLGSVADALTAGQFSTTMVQSATVPASAPTGEPISIMQPLTVSVGIKLWAQTKNATDNATLTFFGVGQEVIH